MQKTFALFMTLALFGCQKISNKVDRIEVDCGTAADLGSYRYVKLVGESGAIESNQGLEVRDEAGREVKELVTSKGCLKVPTNYSKPLVVSRPSANEGYVLIPSRLSQDPLHTHVIKTFRYNALKSSCKEGIVTSSKEILWPIDWAGVDSSAYDWQFGITQGSNSLLNMTLRGDDRLNREFINLSEFEDGVYQLQMTARQLFSKDRLESKFKCRLVIDRTAPLVTLDRALVRVETEASPIIQAAPGEPIRVQTAAGMSLDTIHVCLRPESAPAESCTFDQLTTGYLTAPQRGNWILRLFASDEAGNRGPFTERKLQVVDSNLVATIRSLINQSELAQKAGNFIQSLVLSVRAYEKSQTLGSKAEVQSLANEVRRSVLEAVALPHESLIFKNDSVSGSSGFGFIQYKGRTVFLRVTTTTLNAYSLTGELLYTIDFKSLVSRPGNTPTYRLCENTEDVVVAADASLHIFKGDTISSSFTMPSVLNTDMIAVSQDCQFALVTVTKDGGERQRILMDLKSGKTFSTPELLSNVIGLVKRSDRLKLMVEPLSGIPSLLNLETASLQDLSAYLKVSPIQSIKKAKDASTAVLGKDQKLTLFSTEGEQVKQIESVTFLQASQVRDEYVLVVSGYNALFLASDGSSRGQAPVAGGVNWTYLTTNQNFLVGLSASSNLVKIWTRSSNAFDEIYYKGESIWSILFSEGGNLYVNSPQANRVFQLQSDVIQRKSPLYWNALGLQFSTDGSELFYKEQQPLNISVESYAVSNLVRWNMKSGLTESFTLPEAPLSSIGYPGFGSQMRDLQSFRQNGEDLVAATLKRGTVGIYRANDLTQPIKIYELSSNWLLDLAVDPTGNLLAAANKNGLIQLVGMKNDGWGGQNLGEVNPQYFEEYPVTLHFDPSGQFLYVTDVNRNLMKFAVLHDEAFNRYSLSLVNQVNQAGVNLAIDSRSGSLAVVGQESLLKIFDRDLNLLSTHELSPGRVTFGQSVAFSPDGSKVYAGVYDGSWNELDLRNGQLLKVRFSSGETGATNLIVSPDGDQLAFMGGGFVQLADLKVDRVYGRICTWLKPRLPFIPDLSADERALCSGF